MSKIDQTIVASNIFNISAINTDEDFIACTSEVDSSGNCVHSGLLICCDKELKYFHYTGKKVELTDNLPDNLYYKKLEIIDDELILSFLFHCEKLSTEINPTYGFVFDDSYYDSNGDYYLINASQDITTCVGFCIKVLNGFLDVKYLETSDWDENTLNSLGNLKAKFLNYLRNQGIDPDVLQSSGVLKRILPLEMITSSFFDKCPIKKNDTDSVLIFVESHFLQFKVA